MFKNIKWENRKDFILLAMALLYKLSTHDKWRVEFPLDYGTAETGDTIETHHACGGEMTL